MPHKASEPYNGNCQASVAERVTVSCGPALVLAALALAPGSNFRPLRQPR